MAVRYRMLVMAMAAAATCGCGTVSVKILAINDFHGQISTGKLVNKRPVGSATVVSSYLKAAMANKERQSILVEAGDLVGASPASSALLQDEPAVTFFNSFANDHCVPLPVPVAEALESPGSERFAPLFDPQCNLVGVPGNHEFDAGTVELLRLLSGGNHPKGPFLDDPWRGARFPVVAANIHWADGSLLFRPYVIKIVDGEPIAFVGATTRDTPTIVTAKSVEGLRFSDEAAAINAQVQKLRAQGVHAIVVVIHEGGTGETSYEGTTKADAAGLSNEITSIVRRLDDDVDVVISAHSHAFANAYVKNANGHEVLVTQAFSAGSALADIDVTIDRRTHDISAKSARIITTWADQGSGLVADATMQALTVAAEARVAPIANTLVASARTTLTRRSNDAGESPLGDIVAEAHRAAVRADFGIANSGGLRADLPSICATDPCPITWNDCFTAQPFSNVITTMRLTGQQLYDVLEQQWLGQAAPKLLYIAGFTYSWSDHATPGSKVVPGSVKKRDGSPIDMSTTYTVAVNSFLGTGGDAFPAFKQGTAVVVGPVDLEALITYLASQPQPLTRKTDGRITKVP